uniref:G_PROTEIN_RECEP_F1_2 domain-containing protein n=1 Tax=Heterorhabditis bacteriophora TaxID=37862 RepID=A0A1I7W6U1_HETBA
MALDERLNGDHSSFIKTSSSNKVDFYIRLSNYKHPKSYVILYYIYIYIYIYIIFIRISNINNTLICRKNPFHEAFSVGYKISVKVESCLIIKKRGSEIMKKDMNETDIGPPSPLFSDYIEMAYLGFVIALGVPSNTFILRKLLLEIKRTQKASVKGGFLLLKINLNISDLLILIMAIGKLIWLSTYNWPGGDQACRLYQFLSMFSLYISSNTIVCIAIDRVRNVLGASKIHGGHHMFNPTTVIIALSWCMAFVCSLPQLVVFETYEVFPGWDQCTDIWQLYRFFNVSSIASSLRPIILSEYTENAYNISHLVIFCIFVVCLPIFGTIFRDYILLQVIVFWGPLIVLFICYVFIATKLMQYSLKGGPGYARHEYSRTVTPSLHDINSIDGSEARCVQSSPTKCGLRFKKFYFHRKRTCSEMPSLLMEAQQARTSRTPQS